MARLYILSGPDVGRSFAIAAGALVGRANDCAVVLRDASVSRRHARFVLEDGRWALVDEGSRNGLRSQGARAARVELADLAELEIGEVLVRFRTEGAPAAPLAEAQPRPERAASAAVAQEIELEEIELDEAPAPRSPRVEPLRSSPAIPRPLEPTVLAARPAAVPPASLTQRGERVLQYYKVADTRNPLGSDLAQRPAWLRAIVYLLLIALLAAIGWFAFRATTFLKERATDGEGDAAPAADQGSLGANAARRPL